MQQGNLPLDQIKFAASMLAAPKSALLKLPSNRTWVLAWVAPLYFGIGRGMQGTVWPKLVDATGGTWPAAVVLLLGGLLAVPFGAWVIQCLVRLIGWKLTVKKLMNIYGYAMVPRLLAAVAVALLFATSSRFALP